MKLHRTIIDRCVRVVRLLGFCYLLFWLVNTSAGSPDLPFQPQLAGITLESGSRTLKPFRITSPALLEFQSGMHLIAISNSAVVSLDSTNQDVRWITARTDDRPIRWVAGNEHIAWFCSSSDDSTNEKPKSPDKLFPMDLRIGKWLPTLVIPKMEDGERISSAIAKKDQLVVMSMQFAGDDPWRQQLKQYRLTCFTIPEGRVAWSKEFAAAKEMEAPSAFLLSASRPNEAIPGINPLSWFQNKLLVCAGPRQDLLCLDAGSGKLLASLEKLWEIERSFIGPSVWCHYLSRYERDSVFQNLTQADLVESKKFEKSWRCSIVGGPIVVPWKKTEFFTASGVHIFVAVAKGPSSGKRGAWSSYLSDCMVYELDEELKPTSLATLTRMVTGSKVHADENKLIWAGQNNSMLCLQPTINDPASFGPGGPDLVTKVNWYREFEPANVKAWLKTDKSGDPITFGRTKAYRVISGGYVTDRGDNVYWFPLCAIDFASGNIRQLILRVPLSGPVPVPTTNFQSTEKHVQTLGPYLLAITSLQATDNKLTITLGMEHWSGSLTFELPEAE